MLVYKYETHFFQCTGEISGLEALEWRYAVKKNWEEKVSVEDVEILVNCRRHQNDLQTQCPKVRFDYDEIVMEI